MTYRTSKDEFDTLEMDCIDEDPTQPVELLTPTRRRRHLSLQPVPLTPIPELLLRSDSPTDETTADNHAGTTMAYQQGVETPEDSDLIPLPRKSSSDDDAWYVDTRERTLRFRRWRNRRKRRQR